MRTQLLALEILPESTLRTVVDSMVRLVEAAGAVIIFIGALIAVGRFTVSMLRRDAGQFSSVRLTLGRFLALGLEFQLAADILRTAISPSFDQIGKLAAIAAIRTALNFFLAKEIATEQEALRRRSSSATDEPTSS
ncbi:DUF1622 domain-containing protein [Mycobacterium sp. IDR2000157661]|uniref:DUF1622 domain-containing protein n=1 Tax=Mycobacterium sp. IDR2000157661 TaxID=2867005 RepID=UPI001EEB9500|nr:DUF1622 domain-containing protein [Mycobacterium sp. IDR2000157661]ULE34503.1 DUF1622 domain-containing protein [Mycobacterium sp. IDR2000157661]